MTVRVPSPCELNVSIVSGLNVTPSHPFPIGKSVIMCPSVADRTTIFLLARHAEPPVDWLPIENIQELGRSFDLIVCTGVLHHLLDPDLGLRTLREVLRPQGAMRVMVYARYGRTGIYMMQEYCRLLGVSPSEDDLRELGVTLAALPANHPITDILRRAKGLPAP